MAFAVGHQVRHRITREVGTVRSAHELRGQSLYRVAFRDGTWDVEERDLVAIHDDPFELLTNPPATLYPYDGWLRREAFRLLDAYRNDPAAALSNSRVEPKPHQVSVLIRALEKPQARLILADEVGLGKTIEAGLVLKELRARGVLRRVLILTPASLITQWVWELRSKFNEPFVMHDTSYIRSLEQKYPESNPWAREPNVIASFQSARLDAERVADAEWDLVIFDEAHHARRHWDEGEPRPTKAYELMQALRDRVGGMLLLTATPMQLHEFELYSLVELVDPGLFRDYADFQGSHAEVSRVNGLVSWLRLGHGTDNERGELAAYLTGADAPPEIAQTDVSDLEGRQRVIRWLEARHRLSQALVRNRKAEVGGFTKRVARRIPVEPTQVERELEADVLAYIQRQYRTMDGANSAIGLVLVTFRKLLASSTRALAGALERRAQRLALPQEFETEDMTDDADAADELRRLLSVAAKDAAAEAAELRALAARARQIEDTKLIELERAMLEHFREHPDEKVLIFTQFLGTLEMIRARLARHFSVAVFHGGLTREEKDRAYLGFKQRSQMLVSSEAGGEGRNFQFCHILVNYDLPWNPMKIEQRIGRLDRVGQKTNVLIYNFAVRDTLDEQILDVLDKRIRVFTESVGALDPILGDVEARLSEIFLQDVETARREIARYELDLETRVRLAKQRDQQLQDLIMDAQSFRRDEVAQLLEQKPLATYRDLETFVRRALARYPQAVIAEPSAGVLGIQVPDALRMRARQQRRQALADYYRGTFDYRIALEDETLEFFAFGHPLVDNLIAVSTADDTLPLVHLEGPDGPRGARVLVDYQFRFSGVRPREELYSQSVDVDGVGAPFALECPRDCSVRLSPVSLPADTTETLQVWSDVGADDEIRRRFAEFLSLNDQALAAEQARLERRYSFEINYLQSQIRRNEATIENLERWGTDEQRRVIPAVRGRIRADRERIAGVEGERADELERLERSRIPAHARRILSVTLLLPLGSLESA
jgi:superfamily II DNA or RNA helicase